nr:uncharacterized protein LOC105481503 isoform X1 [Macaca nemestrina]
MCGCRSCSDSAPSFRLHLLKAPSEVPMVTVNRSPLPWPSAVFTPLLILLAAQGLTAQMCSYDEQKQGGLEPPETPLVVMGKGLCSGRLQSLIGNAPSTGSALAPLDFTSSNN